MKFAYVPELHQSSPHTALYAQIASAIALDITRGRLVAGAKLPGTRTLATTLAVHRNTINAAMAELVAQGWIESVPARGMFVRKAEAHERPRPFTRPAIARGSVPEKPAFALRAEGSGRIGRTPQAHVLDLRGGLPDPRLFPGDLLARAYRRALTSKRGELLDYADARGYRKLRSALAEMLSTVRGVAAKEDDVLITRGSQQAIWLAAQVLVSPSDRVVVESYGYQPAWEALRRAGAELVPVPVDREGLSLTALERELERAPIRAIYVTPHHQYPTMVSLSGQRRLRLLELAKRHRFVILEDDYSFEFHYEGKPRLPIASADRHGSVVYVGALSKVLAPGLRLGYAVAPRPLLERMAEMRTLMDRQGDTVGEAAVAELMEDGEVARHIRKMRRIYHARRDCLGNELVRAFRDDLAFDVPAGGMALWVEVRDRERTPERLRDRAAEQDVLVRAGSEMAFGHKKVPFLRLGFTRCDERELVRAVSVLKRAHQSL